MFPPYAVEDNIERKKNEKNVVLNESLNTINKGNGNKVSSVGMREHYSSTYLLFYHCAND
jgi:hypothetical protein